MFCFWDYRTYTSRLQDAVTRHEDRVEVKVEDQLNRLNRGLMIEENMSRVHSEGMRRGSQIFIQKFLTSCGWPGQQSVLQLAEDVSVVYRFNTKATGFSC